MLWNAWNGKSATGGSKVGATTVGSGVGATIAESMLKTKMELWMY